MPDSITESALILFLIIILSGCQGTELPAPKDWQPATASEVLFVWQSVPDDSETVTLSVAGAYDRLGDRYAALAYRALAASQLDEPELWRGAGGSLEEQGDWLAARQVWEALLKLLPDDPQANYRMGVLLAPYDSRRAYQYLMQAIEDPVNGAAARRLGETIARTELEQPAYQNAQLGVTLAALEQWPQAESALEMAVTLTPDYGEAWAYLGLARAQQGKSMHSYFERALVYLPDDALVFYLYGLALRLEGDREGALESFTQAQQLSPTNPAFAAELGATYQAMGDLSAAEEWFLNANMLVPGDVTFLNLLALFYSEELFKLDGNGLTVLQQAAATQPENAEIQAAYAWTLFNVQEFSAAQEAMAQALLLAPGNPRALYYRGLMYQQQAQPDLAIQTLLKLLDQPDSHGFDVLARRALERLGYRPS